MYERNAIVLERYFNEMFGYNMKNNIKTNFKDYCELVECLEKYRIVSEEEETIMQEYDSIANDIREIQRRQETLNKKNNRYQEERANIFQNIDENSDTIQKKLYSINNNIQNLDEEIRENAQQFVNIVEEFNKKSMIRTNCGRKRRNVESEYNKKLNEILDNYKDIDINFEKKAKQFIETETEDIEKELKEKMQKNGEKEKIPFNTNVIIKAINLSIDIQKKETDILTNIYDKTNKLFNEIKNNTTKIDKHKKIIQDSKSKLDFLGMLKEYLVQFLDNERLTAVNGEEEHNNLMKEACKNLDEDLIQINNLYTLLLKEISKKVTKKSYPELYNLEYLKNIEVKSEEFDNKIKKLNIPVTVINPNYWRIEGIRKIYDVFYQCVTENYGRDLSEYMFDEETEEEQEDDFDDENFELDEEVENEDNEEIEKTKRKSKQPNEREGAKTEIDKKIDMILGFDDDAEEDSEDNQDDDWEDDYDDDWEDDYDDTEDDEEDEEDDEKEENSEYIWEEDDDDWEEKEEEDEEDLENDWNEHWEDDDDNEEDDEDDEDDDNWEKRVYGDGIENETKLKAQKLNSNNQSDDDSWENEFVGVDIKDNKKKKKGFFNKFKK